MQTRCRGVFSVMLAPKLLLSPVRFELFAPKLPNLAHNRHFWSFCALFVKNHGQLTLTCVCVGRGESIHTVCHSIKRSFTPQPKTTPPSQKDRTVENLCISEASIHFPRQLLERSMRKRVTYRASPEYGLISIFHSVKNAYFITPHSQPISRNAKCSLFVPRPLRRVGLFLRE